MQQKPLILQRDGLEPNIGLLDASGTAKIFHNLSHRFYAVEFADLCTIAEEIVLRDKIIIVATWGTLPSYLLDKLKPFIDAKVFIPYQERFTLPALPSAATPIIAASDYAIRQRLTSATTNDVDFEMRRILGAEEHTGYAATPLLRQLHYFGLMQKPQLENTICDLAAQYRRISDLAERIRYEQQSFARMPFISLPPIALEALQRCRYIDEFPSALLDMRDKYAQLRKALLELEAQLMSHDLSHEEKFELQANWREKWQKTTQEMGRSQLALARTAVPLIKNGISLLGASTLGEPSGMMMAGIEAIQDVAMPALWSKKIRTVHKSVRNYFRTTDEEKRRVVARLFEYDFVQLEGDMRALIQGPSSPWIMALKRQPPR